MVRPSPPPAMKLIALARWAGSEQLPLQLIASGSNCFDSVDEGARNGLVICNRRLQGEAGSMH